MDENRRRRFDSVGMDAGAVPVGSSQRGWCMQPTGPQGGTHEVGHKSCSPEYEHCHLHGGFFQFNGEVMRTEEEGSTA